MDANREKLLFWVLSIGSDAKMFWNYKANVPRPHLCDFRVPSTFINVRRPQHLANISLHLESFWESLVCYFYTQSPQHIYCVCIGSMQKWRE